MTFPRWFLICLVGFCALCVAPRAAAQGGGDASADDSAAQVFGQARDKWNAKDYAGALPLFEAAVADSGSPNARIYVARCLHELGRLVEAYEQMSLTVRNAIELAKTEDRYVRTRDTAAAELALIEAQLGKVIVVLDRELAGATVTVGERPIESGRIGMPVAVVPGQIVVRASGIGEPVEQRLAIAAGQTQTVTLAPAGAFAPGPAPGPDPPDDSTDFGVMRGIGIGVATLGAAAMVVFAITTVQADDKLATLEEDCGGARCTDPSYADVVDDGQTAETIANVSLVAGAALLAGGAAMIIFGGPSEPDETTALLGVTPEGGFVGLRGSF
ncbi:MAG: hypothetical protein JRI68_11805 [Deltaproteobacteria bacterium]|nr:hypothetical protein [Deltaproteobacteria bacterium]